MLQSDATCKLIDCCCCWVLFFPKFIVFSCGQYGQLGHGNKNNVSLPRMVVEMMGTQVSQVACGHRHTLITSRGRIFAFGLNSSGQCGQFYVIYLIILGFWRNYSFILDYFGGSDFTIAPALGGAKFQIATMNIVSHDFFPFLIFRQPNNDDCSCSAGCDWAMGNV